MSLEQLRSALIRAIVLEYENAARLADLLTLTAERPELAEQGERLARYRSEYGV